MSHNSFLRVFWLMIYYGFARHLTASHKYQPFGKISDKIRWLACKNIFRMSGKNINVERGAHFGSGSQIEIGDNSGIGENCQVPDNIKIVNDVMMGPDVIIIKNNHNFEDLRHAHALAGSKGLCPCNYWERCMDRNASHNIARGQNWRWRHYWGWSSGNKRYSSLCYFCRQPVPGYKVSK